ncbi:SMP-30/gluconolactonase/LRE family protein [Allostreptomyces psammosilenae]|uniref:Sugar lactone lactonase YvrE n=1 Tax=Allostreptomyces psammosilenae TaxID=1892865 RepID=A0A852ZP83_9ACTN|nr:SMP-30/gluconolactonase/LRE family protein [Allostreptomyces psammosilenae]NYI03535.1 sugar lactone lactonase YvrE [Allostreptomyces psammosilenae]
MPPSPMHSPGGHPTRRPSRRSLLRLATGCAVGAAGTVGALGGALPGASSAAFAASLDGGPRAAAALGRRAGAVPLAETLVVAAPELYPEGVAWDPTRQAFLVSSTTGGSVSVVTPDGTVTELVPRIGECAILGLTVDARRGRLLVAYNDYHRRQYNPTDAPPVSGVGVFDLATGATLGLVDILMGRERSCANDLALDDRGNAYVTDSASDTLFRVAPDGTATALVSDPRWAAHNIGPNGIVHHPDGYLLLARYDGGRIFRVDLRRRTRPEVTEVTLDHRLTTIDGMALRPDGTLVVVVNNLGIAEYSPAGRDAVVLLGSDDSWRSATTIEDQPWPVQDPTTVAVTPHGDYVLSGRLGVLFAQVGTAGDFVLRRR